MFSALIYSHHRLPTGTLRQSRALHEPKTLQRMGVVGCSDREMPAQHAGHSPVQGLQPTDWRAVMCFDLASAKALHIPSPQSGCQTLCAGIVVRRPRLFNSRVPHNAAACAGPCVLRVDSGTSIPAPTFFRAPSQKDHSQQGARQTSGSSTVCTSVAANAHSAGESQTVSLCLLLMAVIVYQCEHDTHRHCCASQARHTAPSA